MKNKLTTIDLFCGAGGLSEGFKKQGFNSLLGVDTNQSALDTFKLNNLNSKVLNKDISKLTAEDIFEEIGNKKIDLIIGGPPCQGFSLAGKRDPNDPRNALVKHFLDLVGEIKPKVFLIENVPGLLSTKTKEGKRSLEIIEEISKDLGYEIEVHLLNAADHGVPQMRKRIFIIGSKLGKLNLKISKKQRIPVSTILIKKENVPAVYFYSDRRIKGFREREKKNKVLKRGFGWQFLDMDKPSYTIRARYYKDGSEALVKYSERDIRMLTPEECASIQSFPQSYKFSGGKIKKYIQIGNAVPPKLAESVAKSIKRALTTLN